MKQLPNIERTTFWDIDLDKLNFQEHPEWIVMRIFDRGTLDEVFEIIRYYGFENVKNILVNTETPLKEHAIHLAIAIYHLTEKNFKCLEKKQYLTN